MVHKYTMKNKKHLCKNIVTKVSLLSPSPMDVHIFNYQSNGITASTHKNGMENITFILLSHSVALW